MIKPSIEEVERFSKDYAFIPIYKEIFADIRTTVELLKIFVSENKKCFLLESVESGESWGRYSFLGFDPEFIISGKDNKIKISGEKDEEFDAENPTEYIRNLLLQHKSPNLENIPPFAGGLVGYFSYDYIKYSEKRLVLKSKNDGNFNDFKLMFFDTVIAYDHFKQKIFIISNVSAKNLKENYISSKKKIENIESIIKKSFPKHLKNSYLKSDFKQLFDKDYFCKIVEKAKFHIREGDIFQAVLSNRFSADFDGNLLNVYRHLRTSNPSPYMFYLNFNCEEIAGASPETLITVQNKNLTNYALAGTVRRGKTAQEDEALILALLKDEKELAEHNMLVDLGRNDLGKVSEFGSVKVSQYLKILKFSHVSHIASVINGKLKENCDALDALCAVLPAGTLSGAPKKRACEIIDDLEKHKRGHYGGAIGYIDFAGNMNMCIAIRTAELQNGKVYVQSGAGIVADSVAEKEYDETINKAQAVINALKETQVFCD
ncbi:MAG: anthranilate synthase component I [Elusimicrobiota bacterium]|jgi:anthranilate synthase component 1|nr:anthranilate synthase component I [Elusimicrobiota bacterium]